MLHLATLLPGILLFLISVWLQSLPSVGLAETYPDFSHFTISVTTTLVEAITNSPWLILQSQFTIKTYGPHSPSSCLTLLFSIAKHF